MACGPRTWPRARRMTFPAYRHLLALRPCVRLQSEGAQVKVRPMALVARSAAGPVGLALADVPRRDGGAGSAELLSVFVDGPWRRRGIATALVEAVEQVLRARGIESISPPPT